MQQSLSSILSDVRTKLDEAGLNDSDMAGVDRDDSELDAMIKSSSLSALRFLLLNVDVSILNGKDGIPDVTLTIDEDDVGTLSLPADFLRLISIRLNSWRSSVPLLITEDSSFYSMQKDRYSRGIPERPVAALLSRGNTQKLELYSASGQDDVLSVFEYMPKPSYSNDKIDVPEHLYESFVYYTAGLTMLGYREYDFSDRLIGFAKGLVGI